MCECTVYNFIHWKNRVRTTTFGFGFCSVLYRVGFGSGSCTFFTFRFSLVLDKTWVLVRFVLAGFGFFPISSHGSSSQYSLAKVLVPVKGWCCMVGKDILRVAKNSTRDCRRALDLRSTCRRFHSWPPCSTGKSFTHPCMPRSPSGTVWHRPNYSGRAVEYCLLTFRFMTSRLYHIVICGLSASKLEPALATKIVLTIGIPSSLLFMQ